MVSVSNKERLQANNAELQELIGVAEALPDDESVDVVNSILEKTIKKFVSKKLTRLGIYVLYECRSLETVSIPEVTSIGGYAFRGCTALTSIYAPKVTGIYIEAFYGCTKLVEINFPACLSTTSGCFNGCTQMKKADFGTTLTIAAQTFAYCSALDTLILRGNSVSTLRNVSALSGTPIASGTGYIYVPSSLVDSYKAATNWSTYAAQIRAIEDYPDITGG